jgi:hypothetical protein
VSYLNQRAFVRKRCPNIRYRSLPFLQLTARQGEGTTIQKGTLTCQQKRFGSTQVLRIPLHQSTTTRNATLPPLGNFLLTTPTEVACRYSNRLRSGRLARDYACLAESVSQKCKTSVGNEEQALFMDTQSPESRSDRMQKDQQTDQCTSVSNKKQQEGNDIKGSLTL